MVPPTQSVASSSFLAALSSGQKEGISNIYDFKRGENVCTIYLHGAKSSNDHLTIQEVANPL
jgi:hypothetical protein